jgi:hypothetical protein
MQIPRLSVVCYFVEAIMKAFRARFNSFQPKRHSTKVPLRRSRSSRGRASTCFRQGAAGEVY